MNQAIADVIRLMARVPRYQNYTVHDLCRTVLPPIELGQYQLYSDSGAFVSWAYLTDYARDGYLTRTRKLQPQDWNAGSELWFMDFIAPFGGVRAILRDLRDIHSPIAGNFARSFGKGRVEKVVHFEKDRVWSSRLSE